MALTGTPGATSPAAADPPTGAPTAEPASGATAAGPASATAAAQATGAAAGPASSGPAASVPPLKGPVRRRTFLGSRRRQILAGLVIAGAIAFLVAQGLGNATQYYKTVPQAVTDRASLGHTQFRIMGTVDSDVRQVDGQTEFSISYANVTAQVVDRKEPPQLFKAGVPVVLEGHWAGNVFQSDLIMVKHTAVYNPAEKAVMSTMPGNDTAPSSVPAGQTRGQTAGQAGSQTGSQAGSQAGGTAPGTVPAASK